MLSIGQENDIIPIFRDRLVPPFRQYVADIAYGWCGYGAARPRHPGFPQHAQHFLIKIRQAGLLFLCSFERGGAAQLLCPATLAQPVASDSGHPATLFTFVQLFFKSHLYVHLLKKAAGTRPAAKNTYNKNSYASSFSSSIFLAPSAKE